MDEKKPGRLLNPFAFPSETELRSILLIWAILGLCWVMGFFFTGVLANSVGWPTPDELPDLERDLWRIQESAQGLPLPDALAQKEKALAEKLAALAQPEERDRAKAALDSLSRAAHRQLVAMLPYLLIPMIFLLLTLLVIWGYYFARARHLWFVRLTGKRRESAELQDALDSLVEEARSLQRDLGESELPQPKFLVSRGARGDGQVYGTSRRPLIVLSRAVSLLLRKEIRNHGKPHSIRAFLFHELAHLANRDVTRSYLAEASWVVLIPVLALLITTLWLTWFSVGGLDNPRQHPVVVSLQVLGTLLVIEMIRRGLLRAREHFADLRAGLLWPAGDPLRAILQQDVGISAGRNALLRPFVRLWRKHPTFEERRQILDDPSLVFAIRKDAALLARLLFGNLLAVAVVLTSVLVIAADAAAVLAITDLAQEYAEEKSLVYAMQFYYRIGLFGWSLPSFVVSGGVDSRLLAKAFLFLALFLMTSFAGGAVHAVLLRRRSDAGLSMCFLDGAVIGLLSNLAVKLLSLAAHGSGLDLVLRTTDGPDPVLWFSKLVLGFVIVMIFGFAGLLCGGAGGGLVGLVSIWISGSTATGEKHG